MANLTQTQGIYVWIGYPECRVLWLTGQQVIQTAYEEQRRSGDIISEILLTKNSVINLHNEMYNEYGVYLGKLDVRSITVGEAVRYLGRYLHITRFLTFKEEAERFVKLLEQGYDSVEMKAARMIRTLLPNLPHRVHHLATGSDYPIPHWNLAKQEELVSSK